jgi:hypothetical protein
VTVPPNDEDRRPATNETAIQEQAGQPKDRVSDARAAEQSRRRRNWVCGHIDALVGISVSTGAVDYQAQGFDLGWPERRAAGLAILERERAA